MGERYVPITDLHELADAARRHLLNPTHPHSGFVPASPRLRVAAGLTDVLFAALFAFCFGLVAILLTMAVLNTDFDGPPHTEAQGNWYVVTYLLLGAALYGSPEAFGCRTFGKMMFGLLLVAIDENRPKRGYLRRSLFKTSPLLAAALTGVAGLVHTETLDWNVFEYFGWNVGWELLVTFALPAAIVAFAFLKCLQPTRQTTYDRIGHVLIVRLYDPAPRTGRGFAVVMDRAAPAVPEALAAPAIGGYPPSAANE